jgi:hypothetical protein
MSYASSAKKNSKVAPAAQAYCAHCANIGKPESIYRSHFVRESADPNSRIVCPELLATECPYCYKCGHTKSRCPILLAQEKQRKKEERTQKIVEKKAEQPQTSSKKINKIINKFSVLDDSDSDSEPELKTIVAKKNKSKPELVEQFPALTGKPKVAPTPTQTLSSYASIVAKTNNEYENDNTLKSLKPTPIPTLSRTQASGISVKPPPQNDFWDEWDEENEDEMEYAARQIEMEEYKQRILSMKASDFDNWAQSDSDDEDW